MAEFSGDRVAICQFRTVFVGCLAKLIGRRVVIGEESKAQLPRIRISPLSLAKKRTRPLLPSLLILRGYIFRCGGGWG